jgi:hypothetical protein
MSQQKRTDRVKRVMIDLEKRVYDALANAPGDASLRASAQSLWRSAPVPKRIHAIIEQWLETQGIELPPAPAARPRGRPPGSKNAPDSKRTRKYLKRLKTRKAQETPTETPETPEAPVSRVSPEAPKSSLATPVAQGIPVSTGKQETERERIEREGREVLKKLGL